MNECLAISQHENYVGYWVSDNHKGIYIKRGARRSSVVRAFAHGAMGRWIDPSL